MFEVNEQSRLKVQINLEVLTHIINLYNSSTLLIKHTIDLTTIVLHLRISKIVFEILPSEKLSPLRHADRERTARTRDCETHR